MEVKTYTLRHVWRASRLDQYHVSVGDELHHGMKLATIATPVASREIRYEGPSGGFVKELHMTAGEALTVTKPLLSYRWCEHPSLFGGMCTTCARRPTETQHVQVSPSQPELLVTKRYAETLEEARQERLHTSRKLSLLLDLDLTLLHATHQYVGKLPPNADTIMAGQIVVAWRPGLTEFLQAAHELFELHIYTHGRREYAEAIADCLDPDNVYFRPQDGIGERRITSLDDQYSAPQLKRQRITYEKRIDRVFPLNTRHVLVLDDSNVWGTCPNVIRVRPFRFWKPDGGIYPGAHKDNHLNQLLRVLHQCHQRYYAEETRDVTTILHRVKTEVLAGCKIRFVHMAAHEQIYTLVAMRYGATVVEANATHVIAGDQAEDAISVQWLVDSIRAYKVRPVESYRNCSKAKMVAQYYAKLMEEQ